MNKELIKLNDLLQSNKDIKITGEINRFFISKDSLVINVLDVINKWKENQDLERLKELTPNNIKSFFTPAKNGESAFTTMLKRGNITLIFNNTLNITDLTPFIGELLSPYVEKDDTFLKKVRVIIIEKNPLINDKGDPMSSKIKEWLNTIQDVNIKEYANNSKKLEILKECTFNGLNIGEIIKDDLISKLLRELNVIPNGFNAFISQYLTRKEKNTNNKENKKIKLDLS